MRVYILVREHETIEVMPGREDRRDRLIAAGYEWVNRAEFEQSVKVLDDKAIGESFAPVDFDTEAED